VPSLRDSVSFFIVIPRPDVPSTSTGQALGYFLSRLRGWVTRCLAVPTACAALRLGCVSLPHLRGSEGPLFHLCPFEYSVDSQNGNFGKFICCGVLLWRSGCDIVFMVVEIGAALLGRVFRLGKNLRAVALPEEQQVPHQRTTLVRNDKTLLSEAKSPPSRIEREHGAPVGVEILRLLRMTMLLYRATSYRQTFFITNVAILL